MINSNGSRGDARVADVLDTVHHDNGQCGLWSPWPLNLPVIYRRTTHPGGEACQST